jgi:hypothetical protein
MNNRWKPQREEWTGVEASEEEELAPTTQSVLFIEIPIDHGTTTSLFPFPPIAHQMASKRA